MKKYAGFIPAFLAILVLLGGCMNLLDPPGGGGGSAPAGKGRVEIQVEGGGNRTALPSGTFEKYVLRFAYAGAEGYTHDEVEWFSGLSVELEPGVWTVYLDAYFGGDVSGQGKADVTVDAGTVTPVTIRIGVNAGAAASGTLKYKVSYPTAGHTYGTQALSVRDTDGVSVGGPVTIASGADGFLTLDAGVYFVGVVIEDTVLRTGAARTAAAHIYAGKETYLEIVIGEEEFTALVPLAVTAGLTVSGGGLTVSSRAIAAYSDAGCTGLLATADTTDLTGQAEITLWVPSGSASVYVRQEIVVDGTPLNGKAVEVNITDPGHSVDASLDDTLYQISLDAGIPTGTVTTTAPAAFEGDSVGVTVTPGDTRTLKAGSFMYHNGSTDISLGTGPSATFAMPDAEVTVKAEFYQFVRYGRAGGAGDGLSWETASDDIQKMMDELRVVSLDSATGYTGPYIVKLGAGTYKPKYKPMVPSVPAVLDNYEYNTDTRDAAFILREDVQVWGGYPANGGNETDEADRESRFGTYGDVASTYKAILSGDIGTENDATDNAYHVVLGVSIPANSGTVLDGLTISGGNAGGGGDILVGGKPIYQNCGGGMYNSAASPALIRVTVSGNKAGYGGGMHNESGSSPTLDNVTISGNTLSDTGSGGGMYNHDSGSSPVLNNVMIGGASATDKNTANNGGGIANNDSASPTLNNVTIFGNTASVGGGGIYNSGASSLTLNNVTIGGSDPGQGNTATSGGGIYNDNSPLALNSNVTISGNEAANNGGGVFFTGTGATFTMNGGTISGNKAISGGGGGVYVASGTFTKTGGGTIYGFNEANPDLKNTAGSGDGHAVYVVSGPERRNATADPTVTLDSQTPGSAGGWGLFSDDIQGLINAASSGATIALSGETYAMTGTVAVGKNIIITTEPGAAVILMRDSGFSGDMIKVTGGGLTLKAATGGSLTLDGNGALVTADGPLVRADGGDLTINAGVTLRNNKNSGDGGGVYMAGGTLTMTGGSITLNEAGGNGGGIYNNGITSSSTMANVTISGNKATGIFSNGGGIYNDNSSPTLDGVTIGGASAGEENTAKNGGGMYNDNSGPVLTNVAISGNKATGTGSGSYSGGGGMYNYNSSPVLVNVTISGNLADVPYGEGYYGGGGMFNWNYSSPVLINVTISGNKAIVINATTSGGGGMFNFNYSSPVLINVTIAGNEAARGGGMSNHISSLPVIRNSIIWGNAASIESPGIYNSYDTPSIKYSMVEGESGGTDGNQPAPAASPFTDWKDPDMYAPTTDGDYRLNNTSNADNAKDKGDNDNYPDTWLKWDGDSDLTGKITEPVYTDYVLPSITSDLGGVGRFNGTIDMGAYELP